MLEEFWMYPNGKLFEEKLELPEKRRNSRAEKTEMVQANSIDRIKQRESQEEQ